MKTMDINQEMFGRQMIPVNDIFSMFYREIGPNERPYVAELITKNNGLIETWKTEILSRMADERGLVDAEKATLSLKVYIDGLEVLALVKHSDLASMPEPELPPSFYIIENESVSELWERKTSWLLFEFENITRSIKLKTAKDKFEAVYSKTNEISEWYRLSTKHKDLFLGGETFGISSDRLKAVCDKIGTLLSVTINPFK